MYNLYDNAAKSLHLCPTLCDPIDGSPPGSPVPGILQARILEWVAISLSNVWKWRMKVKSLSHVRLLATPWTAAHQAPPSTGFSRQEYWSGVPLPYLTIITISSMKQLILIVAVCLWPVKKGHNKKGHNSLWRKERRKTEKKKGLVIYNNKKNFFWRNKE